MKITEKGIKLIKNFEGCRLKAYKCPAGIATIGYGHTNKVHMDDVITQADADRLLKEDLIIHENNVSKLVKVSLNQNQFDALVCLEYNIGYGNLASSTLLKMLNSKNYKSAASQFDRWVYAGNKILPGLVKRRHAEKELFLA
ncbi:MAG: lysozyme [Candidatus Gastranaerophilales bacterium]|nr:lysozyme [Candidatus Gastranaerophilales bacterium]